MIFFAIVVVCFPRTFFISVEFWSIFALSQYIFISCFRNIFISLGVVAQYDSVVCQSFNYSLLCRSARHIISFAINWKRNPQVFEFSLTIICSLVRYWIRGQGGGTPWFCCTYNFVFVVRCVCDVCAWVWIENSIARLIWVALVGVWKMHIVLSASPGWMASSKAIHCCVSVLK